eukprot:CAMPEP_0178449714 /NCGR_PEP_ID=MMETSP0689_2-20121128/42718_1 /TAXON_ID=160604 /ORGANISM="Amphidinium massartii, Strain CS-259" /LENGTH=2729 /DNA_ID=CAMNT_0020075091 /DNA_START=53 /DNA_END=8243 /DNA_ORIENTATION=+
MALQHSDYLVTPKPCSNPKLRLVCFPHSGAGPSAYTPWADLLDEHRIEVVAISTPGRERRVDAAPLTDWEVLLSEICDALDTSGLVDDVPYAFFGHSLGAAVACETARRLHARLQQGRPLPVHVFVSAHPAPALRLLPGVDTNAKMYEMGDADLIQALEKYGLLTSDTLQDDGLLQAVMPALRADLKLFETYAPDVNRKPLPIGLTAMGGKADVTVPENCLQRWKEETVEASIDMKLFQGGHFFIDESREEVVASVRACLNNTMASMPLALEGDKTSYFVHEEIAKHALVKPGAEALVKGSESLSFAETLYRAELLAMAIEAHLKNQDSRVVAMLMGKTTTYAVGMIAIFKAAAALLAVETHFPPQFLQEICEDCAARLAIASPEFAPRFKDVRNCGLMELDDAWVTALEAQRITAELPTALSSDVCCLTMTSGTTGKPKTIACSHRYFRIGSICRSAFPLKQDDRMGVNVMFVWEVLWPLVHGLATFIIPDEGVLDPHLFVATLAKHNLTRTLTTPSLLATILQHCAAAVRERLGAMRLWLACGEVLPMKTVHAFQEALPQVKLVNDYSTWESGDVGFAIMSSGPDGSCYMPSKVFAPAGELAPGKVVAIVDPDTKQLLPKGVPGEVYIGGEGVSDGYYKKPEVTAERFVDGFLDEMVKRWSGKWYKTGDLGRLTGEPAVLEIRGRSDSTVKLRGFKVGIPTVEAAIQEVPGVAMCACIPVYSAPGIAEALVCFLGAQEGVEFDAVVQAVKQQGPKKLPRFMMPQFYRPLPEHALSDGESRKLNRRKLADGLTLESLKAPEEKEADSGDAPGTESLDGGVRAIIRSVWAKALSLNPATLDLEENFFDLGGHSTLAAKIASELSGEYGLPITVLDIYSHSSLGQLLDLLDPRGGDGIAAVPALPAVRRTMIAGESVAIVGVAGRFPGADNTEQFWTNLQKAAVSATFVSPELLRTKGVPEEVIKHKDFVPCAYMINDADKFDNQFFGIGRHEATLMDPQHRVFIEVAWAALENAGLPPRGGLSNSVVGVYAAAGIDGYLVHHLEGAPLKDTMDPQDIFLAEVGNEKDYIATRVSYLFDFTGPSMNVNSACSSALVAAVQGAAAISVGQCDAAVAGASSITFPNLGYRYQDGLVNSVDGYVRPFDKDADGTVFGDSAGAVILRRVAEKSATSLAWGTMRGFAVSNDGGQKAGYAAPSPAGQSQAVMNALQMAQIDPWSVSYVECHCTGTRVGDGIEVRGLLDSFIRLGGKKEAGEASVALGSVKGNIAHANCAAGVTGLTKVLHMLQSRKLVPTANFKTLNPKIDLKGLPFFITDECARWDAGGKPLRAGVSSFGIGGTNAHIVVEEPPADDYESIVQATTARWHFHLLPVSAKSPGALRRTAQSVVEGLQKEAENAPDLGLRMAPGAGAAAGAAFTLQAGRMAHPLRQATSDSPDGTAEGQARDLRALATALEENLRTEEELEDLKEAAKKPTVAFVFPGQGSQYLGMARGLYEQVPLFRESADLCCEQLRLPEFLGVDLRPILFGAEGPSEEQFSKPTVLQPSLFIVEYSLAQLLLAVGIVPVAAAGHSLGEYAAAVIGGLLTLEGALAIVAARAKSTETLAEEGAMLSVAEWSAEELEEVASGSKPGLWLAAVNSPLHAVISGEVEAITKLEQELKAAGRKCTRLHIKKAFHSGLVAKAADTLIGLGAAAETGSEAAARAATVPVASNFSGGWLSMQQLQDGTYWSKHMRGTVHWKDNAERLLRQWRPTFVLEVGPGNALSMLTAKCVQGSGVEAPSFVQAMRHPKDTAKHDVAAFLGALGGLWEGGCSINWQALHTEVLAAPRVPEQLRLPTYAFERTSIWKNPEKSIYVASEPRQANKEAAAMKKAPQSTALVRYADRRAPPSIKAYCLPFAGGSSVLFAPWAETEDAIVEVIALELPGRGARSEEVFNSSDADDSVMIEAFCDMILADLAGAEYVLVGCSMGGNLCMEIALRLDARRAQPPLGVYIAGRRPPADDPASIIMPAFTDAELLKYLVAPPEVASSPAFLEHMVPLLRADLQVDTRTEKRLSSAFRGGARLAAGVALEVFCGTNDDVSPWRDAPQWQKAAQVPSGVQYFPGGHEFMMEHRAEILARWRRDAISRLVQRRSAEIAALSAHGFAVPGTAPPAPVLPAMLPGKAAEAQEEPKETAGLPLYAVRWLPATPAELPASEAQPSFRPYALDLGMEPSEQVFEEAVAAMQRGSGVMAICSLTNGALIDQEAEVRQCWRFVQVVHRLLEAGTAGRLVVVCPAAATGSMVSGASKAIAMEASELQVQRLFVPASLLSKATQAMAEADRFATLASRFHGETDIWAQTEDLLQGSVHVQRLERAVEPSTKLPCVAPRTVTGAPATYVLTGATGGLGQAVVDWLLSDQQLQPEQLVLLRRAGSTALTGALAKCKVIEVKNLSSLDELCQSELRQLTNVNGIFHLAGVLDDGVLASMTEERLTKVAGPKCGIASSLLRASTQLGWNLQWFLGFSSTSSLFGYAGQTNYCAANALLDNLATFGGVSSSDNRPEGDRAPCRVIAVNWGPWGEAGMAKKGSKAYEQAVKEGDTPLSTAVALRCLASALRAATPAQPAALQLCACDVAWERSQWKGLPILSLVSEVQEAATGTAAADAADEASSGEQDASAQVQDFLVLHTTGTTWAKIQGKTLIQLGLDSLETVQLRNAFNKEFKVNVPLGLIAQPSQKVIDLVAALMEHVSARP